MKGNFIHTSRGSFHYHKTGETGVPIHFCHGNSLSAGTYLPFLEDLSGEGFQVFASDLRGHGFSTREETEKIESWQIFIKDLAGLVESVTKPPVIGIGHSIGGYFTYAAAALYPHLFLKVVLIDPIIFPPVMVWAAALVRRMGLSGMLTLSKKARHKKYEFKSKNEALNHYKGKGMFRAWKDPFLDAYVETAIDQVAADSYSLCCLPEFEAQIYEHAPFDTWRHAPDIRVPALVIRGGQSDLFFRSAGNRLEKKIMKCEFMELETLGHFLIMEDPALVLRAILPFLQAD